ncbi:MAG: NADH-quinone oxidoreductase subunit L [Phycisphaerales bacterium]
MTTLAADAAHSAVTSGPAWAILIPAFPILGFALAGFFAATGNKNKLPALATVVCLAASFVTTVLLYFAWKDAGGGAMTVKAWDWFDIGSPGADFVASFSFYIDSLTIYWMLFVTGLATLIGLYASEYMSHDVGLGYCRFFAAFNLFVFSMSCLVMGSNLVMLYLGWEGVGLCSYLLIGYFYKKPSAVAAAKKAFIVNRIGDLGLALGLYLTFVHFGTVEYADLFANEKLLTYVDAAGRGAFHEIPVAAQGIALLLMVGAFGKSAQFPLYVWLPDAMEGPTPVSALIHAATMVTAGVYLVARFYPLFLTSQFALPIVAWVGAITALLAATIGMAQFDIKRIMAYSTVSQLGYMFAGLGVLTPTGGAYHVLTHAFFKALLFLACGAVMHGFAGQLDLRKLSGLWRVKGWMVVTIGMFVGCINLAGVPFTAGYFSKDTIIAECFVTPGAGPIGWILLFTAFLTAYYTFRVFFRVFMGPTEYHAGDDLHDAEAAAAHDEEVEHEAETGDHHFHPHAPGWAINSVLAILAVCSIAATGLYFVGGGKVDVHGHEVKAKHYAQSMVLQSTAAYVTPYDHHAFHPDDHSGDHANADHAEEPPAGVEPPERAIERPVFEPDVTDTIAPEREADLREALTHHVPPPAGVGPQGSIGEPLSFFGYDPHKAMYYVSGGLGALGILLAAALHWVGRRDAAHCAMDGIAKRFGPIPRWAENKWYVDEFYDSTIRKPLLAVSTWVFAAFDRLVIDGLIVNGFGYLPRIAGSLIRPTQSGRLHAYASGMAVGVLVLMLIVVLVLVRTGGLS